MRALYIFSLIAIVAGCSPQTVSVRHKENSVPVVLVSLKLELARSTPTLSMGIEPPVPLQVFKAIGEYSDGTYTDLSETVDWTTSTGAREAIDITSFEGGKGFMVGKKTGENLEVVASLEGKSTKASLKVHSLEQFTYVGTQKILLEPIALSNGTVVVGTQNKVLWIKNGIQIFAYGIAGPIRAMVALPDSTVVVASDSKVEWLRNGVKLFQYNSGAQCLGVLPSSKVIACSAQKLVWLENGSVKYMSEILATIISTPEILADGTVVTVISNEIGSSYDRIIWMKDGQKTFESDAGNYMTYAKKGFITLEDGTVVVGGGNGTIYWFKSGDLISQTQVAGNASSFSLASNRMVIAAASGAIYWLKDGVKKYEKAILDVKLFTRVLGGDFVVAFQNDKAILLKNGEGISGFNIGGVVSLKPAILKDETLVVQIDSSTVSTLKWLKPL